MPLACSYLTMVRLSTASLLVYLGRVTAQQCYYGPGLAGPDNLVPCSSEGQSTCCLLGDTCLSGNTCFNYPYGNTYQYGCTDSTYQDPSCPFKCGWNTTLSPWIGMNYCDDLPGVVGDTWVCESPESCGCEWEASAQMLKLPQRDCTAMGNEARVALYAPTSIAPILILPATTGGATLYFQGTTISGTSTWISTPVSGYTPSPVVPLAVYNAPTQVVILDAYAQPSPATLIPAHPLGVTPPAPTAPVSVPTDSITSSSATGAGSTTSSSTSTQSIPGYGMPSASSQTSQSSATMQSFQSSTSGSNLPDASPSSSDTNPSTATNGTTQTESSSGLSSAAKAGIGVGIGVGGSIAIAAVAILLLRRRRRRRSRLSELSGQSAYDYHGDEKEKPRWGFSPAAPYIDSPTENDQMLPTSPVELSGQQPVYELHGNSSTAG